MPSMLCLPMPAADYARLEFQDLDAWRSRFLTFQRGQQTVLELSNREGLPRWLHGSGTNPWERGNRWVLQMALTAEAVRITLIALWDGKRRGRRPGRDCATWYGWRETRGRSMSRSLRRRGYWSDAVTGARPLVWLGGHRRLGELGEVRGA